MCIIFILHNTGTFREPLHLMHELMPSWCILKDITDSPFTAPSCRHAMDGMRGSLGIEISALRGKGGENL